MSDFPSIEPGITDPPEPLCQGSGPFRPNVAALILRRGENGLEILLGERRDTPGCWQWPQGGMDPGETVEDCLQREVREEIGVEKLNVLYQFPFRLRYRFPQRLFQRFNPNLGQEQVYFVASLPANETPDLDKAEDKEFRQLRWQPVKEADSAAIWFKQPVYRKALEHLWTVMDELTI